MNKQLIGACGGAAETITELMNILYHLVKSNCIYNKQVANFIEGCGCLKHSGAKKKNETCTNIVFIKKKKKSVVNVFLLSFKIL